SSRHGDPDLLADGPDEACKLSRNRRNDYGRLLASGDHGTISSAESGTDLLQVCDIGKVCHQSIYRHAVLLMKLFGELGQSVFPSSYKEKIVTAFCENDLHRLFRSQTKLQ